MRMNVDYNLNHKNTLILPIYKINPDLVVEHTFIPTLPALTLVTEL